MCNFILHSGNTRFPFFPLFGRKFTAETIREKCKCAGCLLRFQEGKLRQLLPWVFLGKREIFVFKCIYLAKESLHSLCRMVLREIKFQMHLCTSPTPANSFNQLVMSQPTTASAVLTSITELLCNHHFFFVYSHPRKRQQLYFCARQIACFVAEPTRKAPNSMRKKHEEFSSPAGGCK